MSASSLPLDNPLLASLGVRLVQWSAGQAVFELDLEPRHLNRQASVHGGVIATLLDAACGYAGLMTADRAAPHDAVTAMLSICYLGKADRGRLRATGRVTGGGRRLYFAQAELVADDGRVLATAQGTFKRQGAM